MHPGKTLQKVEDPDKTEIIMIDRRTLPKGHYTEDGFETRQVFDIDISRVVTEYQAQRLINEQGQCFVAPFPKKVSQAVQYGEGIKAHAVYLSQYQLLPYKRIQEYFADQLQMPISEGSLYNFNRQAYEQLEKFDAISNEKLMASPLMMRVACCRIKKQRHGKTNIERCWKGHRLNVRHPTNLKKQNGDELKGAKPETC